MHHIYIPQKHNKKKIGNIIQKKKKKKPHYFSWRKERILFPELSHYYI